MPKYYIQDGLDEAVVDAQSPTSACVKAIRLHMFRSVMIGGHYWVSERGFNVHPEGEDQKICSDEINSILFLDEP